MLSLLLAATVATAGAPAVPAQGTYSYVVSLAGEQVEKTAVTLKYDAKGNIVLNESGSGTMNGRSASIADTLTLDQALAPVQYASDASLADSRGMRAALAFNGSVATQSGDVNKTYSLTADAKHFVVLDFGPFTGYFMLPAQMQAWNDPRVCAIVPMYARNASIAVDKSINPARPQRVPQGDAQISIASPVQLTVWYDPKTLVVDEMDAPDEGLSVTRTP